MKIPLKWRIYLSMVGLIIVTFLITGTATYFNFKEQNEVYNKERVKRKAQAILSSVHYYFQQEREGEYFPFYTKNFDEKIKEFSDIHSIGINIFDLNGILITASNIEQFEKSSIYKVVPEKIKEELSQGEQLAVSDRMEKDRDHLSVFAYLKNLEGQPIAVINVPYSFDIETTRREAYSFISSLAKVYTLMFVLALALGYYLSNYITKSLRQLGARIKTLGVNKKNEPIEWQTNDVIGVLIKEYNRMLKELEKSAVMLAQSERESAWREMAKQVAHEIKNPLTPMQLSVQQIERAWNDQTEDFDERLKRFSKTMLIQIETLSEIASAFSDFAQLPKSKMVSINLVEVIGDVVELFRKEEGLIINTTFNNIESAYIKADKNEILRVFNNLFKNACQAMDESISIEINVSLKEKDSSLLVAIKDNGIGISDDQKANLFTPSFTTKSTGMGLGLSMVKNIISGMGGDIWFQSKQNQGTTFYLSFKKEQSV